MERKDKRFIEYLFPIKEVSKEGAREKNIRHGHISTMHIWWARRPLATSRATIYASLIPAPKNTEEYEKTRDFIIEFSKWENSLNYQRIKQARENILKANNGKPPKILDPFGGGGSIPLEAMRLGCEVYSGDYNPVAVLIQKCTLEYPAKYGNLKIMDKSSNLFENLKEESKLIYDVEKWGNFVLEEAKKELSKFYPNDEDGRSPIGYIWSRTIPCQNPRCEAEIPLMRQFWLAKKKKKKVALFPYIEEKQVKFKIVGDGYEEMPKNFDPSKGTVSRAIVVCPVCGYTIEAKITRKLFQEGKSGERLIAVVLHNPEEKGKSYRIATKRDVEIFYQAKTYLEEKREKLLKEWGMDPVPDENMNLKDPTTVAGRGYGITKWGDLFNARQKLVLIIFIEKVKSVYKEIINEGYDSDYAKAIVSYLGISINRLADKNSSLCRLITQTEAIGFTYGRQALPMLWDYIEMDLIRCSSGWKLIINEVIENISNFIKWRLYNSSISKAVITQLSATRLPYSDNYFDAVITDPPYYDNINYAELSDFFYVWLKRSVGDLYPELFSTPLTPKSEEIVANPVRHGSSKKAKEFFENKLKKAFCEIYRVLKPGGIAIIVYAHKSTEGWETVINALLESGLNITGSYPLNTEMQSRLLAHDTASLSSSIYIIARKFKKEEIGFYNDVKDELKRYLEEKLEILWKEGISGADFFISAVGAGIEVFGKYEKVIDYEGNVIKAKKLLEDIREIVIDYAIKQILHNGISAQISPLTKFYILFRFNYGEAKVKFDEVRKLAQSIGINIENEWNKRFIKKEKNFVKVLSVNEREDLKEILKHPEKYDLIDILHLVLKLWEKSEKEKMIEILSKIEFAKTDIFYKIAQAISETLPSESKEKRLLEGFLTGKERLKRQINLYINQQKQEQLEQKQEDFFEYKAQNQIKETQKI